VQRATHLLQGRATRAADNGITAVWYVASEALFLPVTGSKKMHQGSMQIPPGLFNMPPERIVESLISREQFPEGPATGMRMLTFYLSYAGNYLSPSRLRRLERARKLLAAYVDRMIKAERQPAA
jgi:Protein of unknown function (DUF3175)